MFTAPAAFAKMHVIGDITQKDELIIINKNIVCSARSLPEGGETDQMVVGDYTNAAFHNNSFYVTGRLDGFLFTIGGDLERESVNISIQEMGAPGVVATEVFSSTGNFTKIPKVVGLTVKTKGRWMDVSCSKQGM